MKEFLKYTLASFTALVIMSVLTMIVTTFALVGMLASEGSTPSVADNSVLVLKLSGEIDERAESDPWGEVMGSAGAAMGLDDLLSAIDKAKANDKVKGIYIEAGALGTGYASARAIREKLAEFKKSGKWIVSYADTYTQGSYYICSVADKVLLNPYGHINWQGVGMEPRFYKDLLAKFGVKVQLSKVGKYKSAPEQVCADGMSAPNREQLTALANGVWSEMVGSVSASRKISKEKLNEYADSFYLFTDPANYLKSKFVDQLVYADEARDIVKKQLGIDDDDEINQVSLSTMAAQPAVKTGGEKIAVYYAYGDVVDTKVSGINQKACIAGDKVSADLDALAKDDDVKAVVLRVNTGGGSAYASEQIWHAVRKLKAKKPVVVSMGDYAASGGYYISCGADYIMAEPTTVTGSIGIFAMIPDFSELATKKLGVKFDEVKTNRNANFGSLSRPLNEEEMGLLNGYITRGYQLFISRVAESRKMKVADVDSVAQGRVWLASDALKKHLVDEFGSLDKAVAKAAQLAKVSDYHTAAYPAKSAWYEELLEKTKDGGDNYLDGQLRQSLGEYYTTFTFLRTLKQQNIMQARIPYTLNCE